MKKAGIAALMLLTACLGSGAFDMALETAHDVARRAVATEDAISAICTEAVQHNLPHALERCDVAWDAYDRAVVAMDALLAALDAAKAAQALGQDPDEAALLRASLAAGKAMRDLDAAYRALLDLFRPVVGGRYPPARGAPVRHAPARIRAHGADGR